MKGIKKPKSTFSQEAARLIRSYEKTHDRVEEIVVKRSGGRATGLEIKTQAVPARTTTFEDMPDGRVKRIVTWNSPGALGTLINHKSSTVLSPDILLLEKIHDVLLNNRDGYTDSSSPHDVQEAILQVAKENLSDEVLIREIARMVDEFFKLRATKGISDAGPTNIILGLGTTPPHAKGKRAFESVKLAIWGSFRATAMLEPDMPVFSSARRERNRAQMDAGRKREKDKHLSSQLGNVIEVDLAEVAAEAGLNGEELAFLRFAKTNSKDLPGTLQRATGKTWNAQKIDRVRKRLAYAPRKLKILEAAKRHLALVSETNWLTAGSDTVRKVRSFHANSSVQDWVHKDLLKLFR